VVSTPAPAGTELAEAYAFCERLAREHYENFPVASRLLPARMRPHIAAIYAFARIADDIADEPGLADEERLRLLSEWEAGVRPGSDSTQTRVRLNSDPGQTRVEAGSDPGLTPVVRALHHTIARCNLPVQLFHDLISAFRQDVTVHRYDTWDHVLDYCRRSANPVGRLVLRVAGYDDPKLDAASDALCTALQLTNFWQDLARDWQHGRLYVPAEEWTRAGADPRDLDARRMTPAWQAALAASSARTRALFAAGRPVCDGVGGRLRWELRLTWLGGSRILDRLEQQDFDVFGRRPALGPRDAPAIAWKLLRWPVERASPQRNGDNED
jgi:hydroxysqualene synthase